MSSYSAYAIGRLILGEMDRQRLSRVELARRFGPNIAKGLRRIDRLADTGFDAVLVPKLARALCIDQQAVDEALIETEAEIAREHDEARQRQDNHERETFRPHIFVETAHQIPDPVLIGVLGYERLKRIPVPDALTRMLLDDQIAWVRRTVIGHFIQHGGQVKAFGAITGYIYRRTWDDAVRLDPIDGRLANWFEPRPLEMRPRLGQKRRSPVSPTTMWDVCGHGQETGPLLPLGDDHLDAR